MNMDMQDGLQEQEGRTGRLLIWADRKSVV